MKISIISLLLIVLLSIWGYLHYSETETLTEVMSEKSYNLSSAPKNNTVEQNILNTPQKTTVKAFDREKIMRLSSQIEVCENEETEQDTYAEDDYNTLIKTIGNYSTKEQLQNALILLGNERVLNTQSMTQYYEKALLKEWEEAIPSINYNDTIEGTVNESFTQKYITLATLLDNNNVSELQNWVTHNQTFLDKKLRVKRGIETTHFSVAELATHNIEKRSNHTFNWILNNIKLDVFSIASAIKTDTPIHTLKTLIKHTDNYTELFLQDNKKPGNILTTALLHGSDYEIIEFLASLDNINSPELITPPLNQYVHHLINQGAVKPSDSEKLELLVNLNHKLNLWPNKKTKKLELQGYSGIVMPKFITNELTLRRVPKNIKAQWVEPNEGILTYDQTLLIKEQVNKFKTNVDIAKKIANNCRYLKEQRLALEPKYKNLLDYKTIVKNKESNQEKLAYLMSISPTLTDVFINTLIIQPKPTDVSLIDDWVNSHSYNELPLLLAKGDNIMPHQQSYLAAKICDKFGEQALIETFERQWFIQLYNSSFDSCTSLNNNYGLLQEEYTSRESVMPSKVYDAIQSTKYKEAEQYIIDGSLMHGFKGGRDALALLLDRLVHFRGKTLPYSFELLEILLHRTELKEMHYKRLNRLQLKYPNFYDGLLQKFPDLSKAKDYPVNEYTSFM